MIALATNIKKISFCVISGVYLWKRYAVLAFLQGLIFLLAVNVANGAGSEQLYSLNVQAVGLDGLSKPVPVAITPNDYSNKASGTTPFTRIYIEGTNVTLKAPGALTGGWKLYGWSGVDTQNGTNATLTLTSNTVVKVLYDPAPVVVITNPTKSATYVTTNQILNIKGSASNRCDLVRVEFSNNRSDHGTCVGTTNWSHNGITLYPGVNVLTVTAYDIYSNAASDTLTVTYSSRYAALLSLVLMGGAVVRDINMPDDLVPGETNTIQWQIESYEPVLSGLKIRLPAGGNVTNITLNGTLAGSSNGTSVIGAWQSKVYSYMTDWVVPNVSTGTCRVRFLTARQDGYAYIDANIPNGTDPLNRPFGTDGKEIARDIVSGGTTPAIQNEILTKAMKAFETVIQAQYRAGSVVQNIQVPDSLVPGSVATCRWSILSYPALKTRVRIDLPVEKDMLGIGTLKVTSNAWWRLPATGKLIEYNAAVANDSIEKVTTYYMARLRYYQYVWTVPNDPGTFAMAFEVSPGSLTNWIGAVLPENADGRIETNHVQILRDIETNGISPVVLTVGGINITGNIQYYGDADWYQFVSTGGVYTIQTLPGTLTDTIMKLYGPDDQGTFLDLSDNAVGLMSRITRTLAPGTYYVKITAPQARKGTYKILSAIHDPASMAATYELQVAEFASIYNKTSAWKDWMLANKSRYSTVFSKSKLRPGTVTISFRYETAPINYAPAWADENEHMAVFKAMAHGAYPVYNFNFVVNGNTSSSYANIIAGTAFNTSYAWGKNVYLYYETIFNHEFGHVMGLLHHYDTIADMGNGSHMPPGDTECIMDRTSYLFCSACRTALGIPLDVSDAAAVDTAMNDILSRYPY